MAPPPPRNGWRDSDAPDIHGLLCHYNSLYFDGDLGSCVVAWSNSRMPRRAASCHYEEGGYCEIHLSKFLLSQRPVVDLKNTLLHEMIHAYLWIKNRNNNHRDHGKSFREVLNKIESSSVHDLQRPVGGYKITLDHELESEANNRVYKWICDACGDWLENNIEREPSSSDCIEKVKHDKYCKNSSCSWHRHKSSCSGSYRKMEELFGSIDSRRDSKGEQKLLQDKPMPSTRDAEHNQGSHDTMLASKSSEIRTFDGEVCCEEPDKQGVIVDENCNSSPTVGGNIVVATHATRLATRTLRGTDTTDERKSPVAKGYCPAGCDDNFDSIHTCPSDSQTQKSSKRKELKHTNLKAYWSAIPRKSPGSERTTMLGKKQEHNGEGMIGSYKKHKNDYTVIIEWLDWFSTEEDEIDVEPLVNKRTERRKRQKLLNLKGTVLEDQHVLAASSPRTGHCCEIIQDGLSKNDLICETTTSSHSSNAPLKDIITPSPGNGCACQESVNTQIVKVFTCDIEISESKSGLSQDLTNSRGIDPLNNSDACKDMVCLPCSSDGNNISPLSSPDRENIVEISDG